MPDYCDKTLSDDDAMILLLAALPAEPVHAQHFAGHIAWRTFRTVQLLEMLAVKGKVTKVGEDHKYQKVQP